ncbi:hypothetical protein ACFLRC_02965, partial [Candidatus Altiarchaeota archaeon]
IAKKHKGGSYNVVEWRLKSGVEGEAEIPTQVIGRRAGSIGGLHGRKKREFVDKTFDRKEYVLGEVDGKMILRETPNNQQFNQNIQEGLEAIYDSDSYDTGLVIMTDGRVRAWENKGEWDHKKVMKDEGVTIAECINGVSARRKDGSLELGLGTPSCREEEKYDVTAARQKILGILEAFHAAGLPEESRVSLYHEFYGVAGGFQTLPPNKLFPEIPREADAVKGKLSDFLKLREKSP